MFANRKVVTQIKAKKFDDTLNLIANCFDRQLPHSCNSKHTVAASESIIINGVATLVEIF